MDDKVRIYFATRHTDSQGYPVSETSFIDVRAEDPSIIEYVHDKPVLGLGAEDSFSAHGIHPTMALRDGDKVVLFYQGWRRLEERPYETSIGVAVSTDGGVNFEKQGSVPIFGPCEEDPLYVNGVFIMAMPEGGYRMWYSSGKPWIRSNNKWEAWYTIKTATSPDLLNWTRESGDILAPLVEYECQNSATVLRVGNRYHMWFCYRPALDFRNARNGYRIGYAVSEDAISWTRNDAAAGIDVASGNVWDSEMVCYPYVFRVRNRVLMLYSGNYFGQTGFGYAEMNGLL